MILGEFTTSDEAAKFLANNLTAVNQAITVARHMDIKEKTDIRREYSDLLENILPSKEKELSSATTIFNDAKRKLSDATEIVNATISEAKALAYEVKRGLIDIKLDDLFTTRIPYKGRYYFFTYMDKQLKLCAIRDIPDHEKTEIWNVMSTNEEFIDNNFAEDVTAPAS